MQIKKLKNNAMNKKNIYKCLAALLIIISAHYKGICQEQKAKISYTVFTVNAANKKVIIDWVTDNKVTANYFEIQRSTDGKNFTTVAMVLGPDPKQTNGHSYECFDRPSNKKKYFYRLKHISTDGDVEMSDVKMLALK